MNVDIKKKINIDYSEYLDEHKYCTCGKERPAHNSMSDWMTYHWGEMPTQPPYRTVKREITKSTHEHVIVCGECGRPREDKAHFEGCKYDGSESAMEESTNSYFNENVKGPSSWNSTNNFSSKDTNLGSEATNATGSVEVPKPEVAKPARTNPSKQITLLDKLDSNLKSEKFLIDLDKNLLLYLTGSGGEIDDDKNRYFRKIGNWFTSHSMNKDGKARCVEILNVIRGNMQEHDKNKLFLAQNYGNIDNEIVSVINAVKTHKIKTD